MRILFVSTSSGSRGGGELYLVFLGQALAKRGHTVGLWCSSHSRMDELATQFSEFGTVLRSRYINTYDHKLRSFRYLLPSSLSECRQKWEKFQPDLIHLNKQNLEDGLDLLKLVQQLPYPKVATIHITQSASSLGAFLGGGRDFIAQRALQNFSGTLIAISQTRSRNLSNFLGNNHQAPKVKTIENGVYIPTAEEREAKRQQARSQLGIANNQLLIIAVGRMEEQKRPLLFLEWAKSLKSLLPTAKFLWVGDGRTAPAWDAWVKENNADSYIQRLGWQKDVTLYLAAADAFFHPAQFEGLPFALLEAMAWCLPCFITPSLATELSFPEGVCAIVKENDYQSLKILTEPTQRYALGKKGHQLVQEQFSRDKMVEQYEALYSERQLP
ncbi:MAG: glycosyltransferase family 4 protein [Halothece sp.]